MLHVGALGLTTKLSALNTGAFGAARGQGGCWNASGTRGSMVGYHGAYLSVWLIRQLPSAQGKEPDPEKGLLLL